MQTVLRSRRRAYSSGSSSVGVTWSRSARRGDKKSSACSPTPEGLDRALTLPWTRPSSRRHREIIQRVGEAQQPLRAMRTKARDGFIKALRDAHRWLDELVVDPTQAIKSLAIWTCLNPRASGAGQSRPLTDASPGSQRSLGRRVHPQRLSARGRHIHALFRTESQSFLGARAFLLKGTSGAPHKAVFAGRKTGRAGGEKNWSLIVAFVDSPNLASGNMALSRCHAKARAVYALRIFKPPRRPRATWSSPRRVARGEIELT